MSPPFDILVAGDINADLILTVDVTPAFDQTEKPVDAAVLMVGVEGRLHRRVRRRNFWPLHA